MRVKKAKRPDVCLYCGGPGLTRDHVVPLCFLEEPLPSNLLTVRSCYQCNSSYGFDEQYFLVVMASTGNVPSLHAKTEQGGVVDKTLSRAPLLDDRIIRKLAVDEGGRVYLNVEEKRMARVLRKIAFGLYWHRYSPNRTPQLNEFRVWPIAHAESGENSIVVTTRNDRFIPKRWSRLQKGVFEYMFSRNWLWRDFGGLVCIMRIHNTVWAAVSCPEWPCGLRSRHHRLRLGEQQFSLFG